MKHVSKWGTDLADASNDKNKPLFPNLQFDCCSAVCLEIFCFQFSLPMEQVKGGEKVS